MSFNTDNIQKNVELTALYQEVILEHVKRPRYKGRVNDCQFCQEGKNPLCGDTVTIFCEVNENSTFNIRFEGVGCSISQASASIMCEALQKAGLKQAQKLLHHAEDIYTGKAKLLSDDLEEDLEALYGVSKFPVRIKCAALPWKTLEILLAENFDAEGNPKEGCNKLTSCVRNNTKKLKVVSMED